MALGSFRYLYVLCDEITSATGMTSRIGVISDEGTSGSFDSLEMITTVFKVGLTMRRGDLRSVSCLSPRRERLTKRNKRPWQLLER